MQWVKTLNKKKIALLILFIVVFLATRFLRLDSDVINPDAVNWHYRSEQFVVGLKHFIFEKTYQHYHPGVTLMWITGIPIELAKQITGIEIYDRFTFPMLDLVAKTSLIFVQLFLTFLIFCNLSKIIGFYKSLGMVALLSLEPFFIGNSRMYHMDVLFTLLTFLTLIYAYSYFETNKERFLILAGVASALTFLTRSIGLGLVIYLLFAGFYKYFIETKEGIKKVFKFKIIFVLIFVATTFILFPALWQKPIWTIVNIFTEGKRIGINDGHSQIFFGNVTENPGFLFYPTVLLMKLTPFVVIGVALWLMLLFVQKRFRIKKITFVLFSGIFYLGYFVVMSIATKKLDRYMLTLFPYFALLATLGYFEILNIKNRVVFHSYSIGLLFILFVVIPVVSYHPYSFTYTSPIFGTPSNANFVIGQKPFGVGIYEVKEHLERTYGAEVEVGFIDTKPIKSIYPNSLVSDARVEGTSSYDVLVLAINETFPENVTKSGVKFTLDGSIYINGLDYWRFYVKENQ